MLALSPKALALAAITMSISSSALACLELSGVVGEAPGGSITATDNGVQTCSGSVETGDENVGCIDGYALNYDYTDNNPEGPLPITYCNPTDCYSIEIPLDCDIYTCTFDYSTFC